MTTRTGQTLNNYVLNIMPSKTFIDFNAIAKFGLAYGIELKGGAETVWLQGPAPSSNQHLISCANSQ